jgi:hypothetical protein
MKTALFLFLLVSIIFSPVSAQEPIDTIPKSGGIDKVFDFGDQVIDLISGEKWAFIPAVTYSPETKLGLGVRAIRVFKYKGETNSNLRPSSIPITILYTLNNQTIFTTELDLWANENKEYVNAG